MEVMSMDHVTEVVEEVAEKATGKKQPISPKVHGIIDYTHAALFFGLGVLARKSSKAASNAAFATGAFVLVQSLLTDYPLGVKKVIPFKTHLQMDGVFAAVSWAVPEVFGFSGTWPARIFEGNTPMEGMIVKLTKAEG